MALHNAGVFARLARIDAGDRRFSAAVDAIVDGRPALWAGGSVDEVLRAAALLACRAAGGRAAVAAWGEAAAGAEADGAAAGFQVTPRGQEQVVTAEAAPFALAQTPPSAIAQTPPPRTLALSVILPGAPAGHEARALRLVAASAAQVVASLP